MCYIGDMEDTRFFCHFTCLSVRLQKNPKIIEDTGAQMENIWKSVMNIQNNVGTTNCFLKTCAWFDLEGKFENK